MNFTQEQRYEIIEKIIKEGKGIEEILKKLKVPRTRNGNFYPVILGLLRDREEEALTSSTCHPKIIRKQWSDTLMPFH